MRLIDAIEYSLRPIGKLHLAIQGVSIKSPMSSLTDHGAIADQVIAVLQPLSESIGTNNVAKPHIRRLI